MLQLVRIIIAHSLHNDLLRIFVSVLVVADVDSAVNKEQIDKLAVVLQDHVLQESVRIGVCPMRQQVLSYRVIVLRTDLDEAEWIL